MGTACLTTTRASAIRCQYCWGGAQVRKIEQVSSYGHQMSLAGVRSEIGGRSMSDIDIGGVGGVAWVRGGGPMSDVQGGLGEPYSEVQCIVSNGHMGTPL